MSIYVLGYSCITSVSFTYFLLSVVIIHTNTNWCYMACMFTLVKVSSGQHFVCLKFFCCNLLMNVMSYSVFETGSHYVKMAGLHLDLQTTLAFNSQRCTCLLLLTLKVFTTTYGSIILSNILLFLNKQ